ncbi:MAG: Carboxylesterase NlhH [Chloroflexota bacterium]|jgi:hypothetical protein
MKRLSLFITLLAVISLACNAGQSQPTAAVKPTETATSSPVETEAGTSSAQFDSSKLGTVEKDTTYCTVDGVELKMDVYYPSQNNGRFPVTMYVHGGGWSSGDKAQGAGAIEIPELQKAGFLVVSVNYRLAPEYVFPAMIEDVKCAVRSLRAHAEEYNLDPNRIGVWGGSAGGHLVALLGTSYIARYYLVEGSAASFSAGTWPIPLRRDSAGDFLFSLNAWDSTLSVYSMTPSETLLGTISLGIPAGSTDRLPDLAIDSTHKLAFAAYPEFGLVAVVNWETMQPVTTINIPNAETGDTGGGPGQLQVIVNESANRLFVYEPKARAVYVYDTANNFSLLNSVDVKAQSKSIGQADADLFFFDATSNRLFLGTVELDSTTGQPTGNLLPAGNKIFGMDSEDNLYWVLDSQNSAILALDRTSLAIRHSQPMPESSSNLATAAYDPVNKQVFIGYLITANLYGFSVGQIP